MYTAVLAIAMAMMLYGIVRTFLAEWRHESNKLIHALWIPGAAFLYVVGIVILNLLPIYW